MIRLLLLIAGLLVSAAANTPAASPDAIEARDPRLVATPLPRLGPLEPAVREQIEAVHAGVAKRLAEPDLTDRQAADAYGFLAEIHHAYGFEEAARSGYRNARALAPDTHRWAHLHGVLEIEAGDLGAAAELLAEAKRLDPGYAATAARLGAVYLQQNRLQEAERELGRALELAPESAAAQYGLGEIALRGGSHDEAVTRFQQALENAPSADRIHYSLAMAFRGLGRIDQARAHLAESGKVGVRPLDPLLQAVEAHKRGARVRLLAGRLAFAAGRYGEAVEAFAKAVEAEPESRPALVNLAAALARLGDLEGARDRLRTALEVDSADAAARFNLGVIEARLGDFPQAAANLEAAVELSPNDAEARRKLAAALLALGRSDGAVAQLEEALERDPADQAAAVRLADIHARRGRLWQARTILERAHAAAPAGLLVSQALARLLAAGPELSVRDGRRAHEIAASAFAAQPTVAHGETLAMALAELGRCQEAARLQEKLVETARTAQQEALAEQLEAALKLFAAGQPCRIPFDPV